MSTPRNKAKARRKGFSFSEGGIQKQKDMSEPMPGLNNRSFKFTIQEESQVLEGNTFEFLLGPSKYDNYEQEKNRRLRRRIKEVTRRNFINERNLEC
jgi:hypothetical protein